MLDDIVNFRLAYDDALDSLDGGSHDEQIESLTKALGVAFDIING